MTVAIDAPHCKQQSQVFVKSSLGLQKGGMRNSCLGCTKSRSCIFAQGTDTVVYRQPCIISCISAAAIHTASGDSSSSTFLSFYAASSCCRSTVSAPLLCQQFAALGDLVSRTDVALAHWLEKNWYPALSAICWPWRHRQQDRRSTGSMA